MVRHGSLGRRLSHIEDDYITRSFLSPTDLREETYSTETTTTVHRDFKDNKADKERKKAE